jgi:pyrophosphatase PpaX
MSRAGRLRAVVFDLDGTLLDSMPLVLAAVTHAIEPFAPRPSREIFARLGGPPERFMATLLDEAANLPVALTRFEGYHRSNAHLIRPFEGAERVLQRLRTAGVQLGIWTGRDRVSTEWLLKEHRLEGYFATAVCGDDLPSHKPDPAGLQELMRRFGVAPAETLFVGDADVDVLGGVGGGVDTLLIRHTRDIHPDITAQSWRTVLLPAEAFDVIFARIQAVA